MLFLTFLAGCERQNPIVQDQTIVGYQIQGKVTDPLGNPIPNVTVYVDYTVNYIGMDTVVSRQYYISDSTVTVQAVVTDWSNHIVMALTPPKKMHGWFQALWDGKDSAGSAPPSGIYAIRYLVGGRVVFSYNQLVSGGPVAKTDIYGGYTIPIQYLPIDSTSVPYFSPYDSSYVGNYLITNDVFLTYSYPPHTIVVERLLTQGLITVIDVTF